MRNLNLSILNHKNLIKPALKLTLMVCLVLLKSNLATAQLTITVTGETNTTPNLATSYVSLGTALAAINAVTAMSGPVVLSAGTGSEIAPSKGFTIGAATLNSLLSSTNTLTINGNGSSVINAGGGSAGLNAANPDGMVKIVGADYVTFNNFKLNDNNTTTTTAMEFGIGIFKNSTVDGAQHNTITNNTITLPRLGTTPSASVMPLGSAGILMLNNTPAGAASNMNINDNSGASSFNTISNNTMTGGYVGLFLNGSSSNLYSDTENAISDNTILNFAGVSGTTAHGIYLANQWNATVDNNNINNNNGSGVDAKGPINGISTLSGGNGGNLSISGNIIIIKNGSSGILNGINNNMAAGSGTTNINNNTIKLASSNNSATTVKWIASLVTPTNLNINNNILEGLNGLPITGSSIFAAISNAFNSADNTVVTNGNKISNISRTSSGSSTYGLQIYANRWTANDNKIDNLKFTALGSSGSIYGIINGRNNVQTYMENDTITNLSIPGGGVIYGIYDTFTGLKDIVNNTISNFTATQRTSSFVAGIISSNGTSNISSNKISNFDINATNSAGICGSAGQFYIVKNKINNITNNNAASNVQLLGINLFAGSADIYNNVIGNLSLPLSDISTNEPGVVGINVSNGTAFNLYHNTVLLNATSSAVNFGSAAIYAGTNPNLTLRNNIFINKSTPNGIGKTVAYQRQNTTLTSYSATSNNNLFAAPSIYFDGSSNIIDLPNYKTVMGTRDQNSVSETSTAFMSTDGTSLDYLRFAQNARSIAENNGVLISSPLIITDYWGVSRPFPSAVNGGTNPDIGASEFDGKPCPLPIVFNVSGNGNICAGGNTTITLSNSELGFNYQLMKNNVNLGSLVAGTGAALLFLNLNLEGNYTMSGVSNELGCINALPMSGSVLIATQTSVGGSINGSMTVCAGSVNPILTLTGQSGTVQYWQSAVSPYTTWTNIAHTGITYTPSTLTETTQYRVVVKIGDCDPATSAEALLTLNPVSTSSSTVTACNKYEWFGVEYVYTGTYTHVIGCHTDTLKLTINWIDFTNSTPNITIATGTSATLNVGCSPGEVKWYTADESTLVYTGTPFITPALYANTTYRARCETPACNTGFISNNVTVTNAGAALSFDGVDDFVLVPASSLYSDMGGTGFTLESWVYNNNVNNNPSSIIRKTGQYNMMIEDNKIRAEIWPITGNSEYYQYFSTQTFLPNTWNHLAVVWDGSTAKFYINGVLDLGELTAYANVFADEPLQIGMSQTYAEPFTGKLDEVRIWNRPLCGVEIQHNRNCEIATTSPGLVLNYHFNQGISNQNNATVTSAVDASGYGLDGPLQNFTLNNTESNWVNNGGVTSGTSCTLYTGIQTPTNPGTQSICKNTSVSLSATCVFGTTTWYAADGTSKLYVGSPINTGNLSANISYKVRCESGICLSEFRNVDVEIKETPENPSATAVVGINTNIAATLSATCTSGFLNWYDANFGAIPFTGSPYVTPILTGNTTYQVRCETAICNSAFVPTTVKLFNSALNFDANNDYVEINDAAAFDFGANDFSVEFWVKNEANNTYGGVNKWNTGLSPGTNEWAITLRKDEVASNNKPNFLIESGTTSYNCPATTSMTLNTWYHVAGVREGTNMKIYVNGILENTVAIGTAAVNNVGRKLLINRLSSGNYGGASYDELRIWSRALPECEIKNNMNAELSVPKVGLQAYYRFNQGFENTPNPAHNILWDDALSNRYGTLFNFALTGTSSNYIKNGTIINDLVSPTYSPITATSPQTFCGTPTVANLSATGINIKWFATANSTTELSPSIQLTSGSYFASQSTNKCETAKTEVVVSVANLTPTVSIAITSGSQTTCAGSSVTFTATPTHGGTPTYQWKKDGVAILGETAATFTSTTLTNNAVISVDMTSTESCVTSTSASSAGMTMTVNTPLTPTVSIAITSGSQTICAGSSVTFTATPTHAGTPTYQWKKDGVAILGETAATFTSTTLTNNAEISVNMSSTESCVTSTSASSAGMTMTVNTPLTPTVSIAITSGSQTICAGSSVTFTATPTHAGTPTYQWKKDGVAILGETAATFTSTTLTNNAEISVNMSSTESCVTSTSASSAGMTMTVNTLLTPTVSIAITSGSQTLCAGSSVTFTATPTHGGTPTYQWKKDGVAILGETAATFTSTTTLTNNAEISVDMTSTESCITSSSASSAGITMTVNTPLTPTVSVAITSGSQTICAGSSVTFTATPSHGGTPTYQWIKDGVAILGETAATFISTTLTNNAVISVDMTSTESCVTSSSASSAGINMTVNTNLSPAVSVAITSGSQTICASSSVTFTATPTHGGTPTYQWKKDGVAILGETAATFTSTALSNNAVISVDMTSTESCVTSTSASSAGITMTVNAQLTPAVSVAITSGSQTICAGSSVTFTATPSHGGTPTYQWKKDGVAILGETAATFISTTLANNTVISLELVSSESCVTKDTVKSNGILMHINENPTTTISDFSPICEGMDLILTATTPNFNPNTLLYSWSGPGGFVSNSQNINIFNANPSASGAYILNVRSSANCTTTQTRTVTVNPKPSTPNLTTDKLNICKGENATMTGTCANINDVFRWTTAALSQNGLQALTNTHTRIVTEPGTYKGFCESDKGCLSLEVAIVITQSNNCNTQAFLTVSPAKPIICPNTGITLTASGCSGTVSWQAGTENISGVSATFYPTISTTYQVICSTGGITIVEVQIAKPIEIIANNQDSGKSIAKAVNTLESNKKIGHVEITPGASVTFEAGNAIVLLPGFSVEKYSNFKAEIKKCSN